MDELKPCPFCGEKVRFIRGLKTEPVGIYCSGCKAAIRWPITIKTKETFGGCETRWAKNWNRRSCDEND